MEKKAVNKKIDKKAVVEKAEKKEIAKKSVVQKTPIKSEKLAVIKTGGKQYKVREGEELLVEKLKDEKAVTFSEVLLVADGKDVKIGTPFIDKAKVEAKVLSEEKGKKVIVFKMKAKKRYRKKTGHRQKYTKVKIEKISA